MARPAQPQPMRQAPVRPQQQGQAPMAAEPQYHGEPPQPRRRVWLVVLQFVIGLLVIAGVAAAIVALYLRYYQ